MSPVNLVPSGRLPVGMGLNLSSNGRAQFIGSPAAGTAGTYPLTIIAIDAYGDSVIQDFTLTVLPAPTTLALTSLTNPALPGQSFTLHAVTTSADGPPSGTVEFFQGAAGKRTEPVPGCTAVTLAVNAAGNDVANCALSRSLPGSYNFWAAYAGGTTFAASSSGTLAEKIMLGL